jgi:hypothetical protein
MHDLIILIFNLVLFDVVDDQSHTGKVRFIFICTEIHSTYESDCINSPGVVIVLNNLPSDFHLLFCPLFPDFSRDSTLQLLEFGFFGFDFRIHNFEVNYSFILCKDITKLKSK